MNAERGQNSSPHHTTWLLVPIHTLLFLPPK
jgi:hypothetical protein